MRKHQFSLYISWSNKGYQKNLSKHLEIDVWTNFNLWDRKKSETLGYPSLSDWMFHMKERISELKKICILSVLQSLLGCDLIRTQASNLWKPVWGSILGLILPKYRARVLQVLKHWNCCYYAVRPRLIIDQSVVQECHYPYNCWTESVKTAQIRVANSWEAKSAPQEYCIVKG